MSTRMKNIRFDSVTMSEAVAVVRAFACQRLQPKYVCFATISDIELVNKDKTLAKVYEGADLVVAESPQVAMLARISGNPIPGSISKTEFVYRVGLFSMETNSRVFLLGGEKVDAVRASDNLQRACPGMNIVGQYSPPKNMLLDWGEQLRMRAVVRSCAPDVLLVSFDSPLQEKWIRSNLLELNVPVTVGVGDVFRPKTSADKVKDFLSEVPAFVRSALMFSYDRIRGV